MGDAFLGIGADQCIIQQLAFFMVHVGNEQAEENMKPLDLCGQQRSLYSRAIQQLVNGFVHLSDLEDIDAVF